MPGVNELTEEIKLLLAREAQAPERADEREEFKNLQERPQELSPERERELIEKWYRPSPFDWGGEIHFMQTRIHERDLFVREYMQEPMPRTPGNDDLRRELERFKHRLDERKHNPDVDGAECEVRGCDQ